MNRSAHWLAVALASAVLLLPVPLFAGPDGSAPDTPSPDELSIEIVPGAMPTYGWAVAADPAQADAAIAAAIVDGADATLGEVDTDADGDPDSIDPVPGTPRAAVPAPSARVSGSSWAVLTGDNVHVRLGPGRSHKSLRKAARGEHFVVLSVRGEWAAVQAWPTIPCYASSKFIDGAPGQPGTFTGDNVNLRIKPEVSNSATPFSIRASKGTEVNIVAAVKADWYRIMAPKGVPVFIHASFLARVGSIGAHAGDIQAELNARVGQAAEAARAAGNRAEANGFGAYLAARTPAPSTSRAPSRTVEDREREVLASLQGRARALMSVSRADTDITALYALAVECDLFARECQTRAVHIKVQETATTLREHALVVRLALEAAAAQREIDSVRGLANETVEEYKRRMANLAAQEAARARQAAKDAVLAQLVYTGRNESLAKGVIVDRVIDGQTVYFLEIRGRLAYRLLTGAGDMRRHWRKAVSIRGRIVTYSDDDTPGLSVSSLELISASDLGR